MAELKRIGILGQMESFQSSGLESSLREQITKLGGKIVNGLGETEFLEPLLSAVLMLHVIDWTPDLDMHNRQRLVDILKDVARVEAPRVAHVGVDSYAEAAWNHVNSRYLRGREVIFKPFPDKGTSANVNSIATFLLGLD